MPLLQLVIVLGVIGVVIWLLQAFGLMQQLENFRIGS